MTLVGELSALLGEGAVIDGQERAARPYLHDETESRAITGDAAAVTFPREPRQVAELVAWCYEHDVAIVPRGGGTGFAGGAVPQDGAVVVSVERLSSGLKIEPEHWRAWVPAGIVTARLRQKAREKGLYYAPDPGAAQSSLIGGNIATNAGGPHTFKYGQTGTWVTGLEVVLAPGELVKVGGVARKDVGGYDLTSLLVGSEGTLGIVTGAYMKLLPAPEAALPVVGFYPDAQSGQDAILAALASGTTPAAIEFLDQGALAASLAQLVSIIDGVPAAARSQTGFMVITEADGSRAEAEHGQSLLAQALGEGALAVHAPTEGRDIAALWRWRDGVSGAVTAQQGGKISEDIVVGVEQIAATVEKVAEIAARHDLPACNWGHAGDGNIHATFMVDRTDRAALERAELAAHELFEHAAAVGGAVSGEHGLGTAKNGALALQWPEPALRLHEGIKQLIDPKGLINPGKKLAR